MDEHGQKARGGQQHEETPRHQPRPTMRIGRPRAAPAGEHRERQQAGGDREREGKVHLRRHIAGRFRERKPQDGRTLNHPQSRWVDHHI
jgi:hypothetical protein